MDISHAGKLTLEERDGGAYPTTAVTYNNSMIIKYQRRQKMKGYQPSVAESVQAWIPRCSSGPFKFPHDQRRTIRCAESTEALGSQIHHHSHIHSPPLVSPRAHHFCSWFFMIVVMVVFDHPGRGSPAGEPRISRSPGRSQTTALLCSRDFSFPPIG